MSYPDAARSRDDGARAAGRWNDVARLIVNLAQIERAYLGLKFDRDGLTDAEVQTIEAYRPPSLIGTERGVSYHPPERFNREIRRA